MQSQLWFASVIVTGCLAGLASAWWAVDNPPIDLSTRIGPWRVTGGDPSVDPYTMARATRAGTIEMAREEGLQLAASGDSDGHALDPRCSYRIAGPLPKDAPWTIVVSGRDGALPETPKGRIGFTSYEALRYGSGYAISMTLAPEVGAGDGLTTGGLVHPTVTLRLYTPMLNPQELTARDLPGIVRTRCAEEERS